MGLQLSSAPYIASVFETGIFGDETRTDSYTLHLDKYRVYMISLQLSDWGGGFQSASGGVYLTGPNTLAFAENTGAVPYPITCSCLILFFWDGNNIIYAGGSNLSNTTITPNAYSGTFAYANQTITLSFSRMLNVGAHAGVASYGFVGLHT